MLVLFIGAFMLAILFITSVTVLLVILAARSRVGRRAAGGRSRGYVTYVDGGSSHHGNGHHGGGHHGGGHHHSCGGHGF